ncbi:hypothetical protein ACLKA6_013090 [Drosophila palustris]
MDVYGYNDKIPAAKNSTVINACYVMAVEKELSPCCNNTTTAQSLPVIPWVIKASTCLLQSLDEDDIATFVS